MKTRSWLKVFCAGLLWALASAALAQPYPNRAVRVIIPFPPGGTLDVVGRMLAQKLAEQTGQAFVIENRAGGNGTIGASAVTAAAADGYTLLFSASTFTTTPMTMQAPPYDVIKDFTPVALVAKAPLSIAVRKEFPASDLKGVIAYAKAHPGELSFARAATAAAGHLATEQLKRAAGIEFLVVPYKGTAPAFQDILGGRIDGFIDPILGALNYHKAGQLRIVAVTSSARVAGLPDVPTVAETIPGFEAYSWYGLWGPAKLPVEIARKLNEETARALASDMRDKLEAQGLIVTPGSIEDFVRFQRDDMAQAQKVITEGKIRND